MSDISSEALNIADLREMAQRRLPRFVFEWLDRGAEDEVALRNNRQAYEDIKLKARVLQNVSTRSLETKLFGKTFKMPYGISPTGTSIIVGPAVSNPLRKTSRSWSGVSARNP